MKKYIKFICFSFVLSVFSNSYAAKFSIIDQNEFTNTEVGFFNSEGKKVFLDQYEGEAVLLVFWATWCGACVNEIPSLDNLAKDFRKLPFKVIALSVDQNGLEAVKKHYEENEIRHLDIFHDYKNQLQKAMSVNSLPSAFLINKDGKIKKLFKGTIKWHKNDIREILLTEIYGNPEMPQNTYKDISLNKTLKKNINPVSDVSEESKNDNKNENEEKNDEKNKQ